MLFKITAKKKLDELLAALNLSSTTENIIPKEIDVSRMNVDYTSKSASEMIKAKLKEHGGHGIYRQRTSMRNLCRAGWNNIYKR